MIGEKFNRLTIVKFAEIRNSKRYWECLCQCGTLKTIREWHLTSGKTRSCGCIKKEGTWRKTHGMTRSPTYITYIAMKSRCYRKSNDNYSYYGGRGITVCERWLESFENFHEDMGDKPSLKHSLDRINVEGNYHKENCRWATILEQANNKRKQSLKYRAHYSKQKNRWLVKEMLTSRKKKQLGSFISNEAAQKFIESLIANETKEGEQ